MACTSTARSSVTLIGAGTQGRRLAYMWASRGNDVHIIDSQPSQLDDSVVYVQELRKSSTAPTNPPGIIHTHSPDELHVALQNSWLVVECVPEKLSLKRQIIAQIEAAAPEDTILASNSSSYTISEIIDSLNLRDASRVLSAHSYWPPETKAIEIMGHAGTKREAIEQLVAECESHGFSPFHVKCDSIGYIYNRIWAAIKREALLVAAEGVATPQEVDDIFKDVLKTPKGPFEQMDIVGLDVVLDIEEHYARVREGIPKIPRQYLKGMIGDGKLGVKSGHGFHDYRS